jgi:hypothetical protein
MANKKVPDLFDSDDDVDGAGVEDRTAKFSAELKKINEEKKAEAAAAEKKRLEKEAVSRLESLKEGVQEEKESSTEAAGTELEAVKRKEERVGEVAAGAKEALAKDPGTSPDGKDGNDEKDEKEKKTNKFLESGNKIQVKLLVYFAFLCVLYFTVSLILLKEHSSYKDDKTIRDGIYAGAVGIGIFIAILTIDFNEGRDLKQQLSSAAVLLGTLFIGGVITFLYAGDKVTSLDENRRSRIFIQATVVLYFVFILAAAAYIIVGQKSKSKGYQILRMFYSFYLLTLAFVLGGISTNKYFKSDHLETTSSEKTVLLIGTVLFIILTTLALIVLISRIPFVGKTLGNLENKVFKSLIKGFEKSIWTKILVLFCMAAVVYFVYLFYNIHNDGDLSGTNAQSLLEWSYAIGAFLILIFISVLSATLGGNFKQRLVSFFMVTLLITAGVLLNYLDDTGKLGNLTDSEQVLVNVTKIVFLVVLAAAIVYTLFFNYGKDLEPDKNVGADVIAKISINIGIILFFLYCGSVDSYIVAEHRKELESKYKVLAWAGTGVFAVGSALAGFVIFKLLRSSADAGVTAVAPKAPSGT